MENNYQQSQSLNIPPPPPVEAPPKSSMLKKIFVAIFILALLGVIGFYLYKTYGPKKVTTTGAIIIPSTPAPDDPYFELNKLLDMGEFSGDGFSIKNVSRSTEVAVFLDKPYDQSQVKFEAWLKANGYGEIPKEKIIYFHNP